MRSSRENSKRKGYVRKAALFLSLVMVLVALSGCQGRTSQASAHEREGDHPDSPYFSRVDFYNAENTDSLTILPRFKTTQQTTWWPCGVSVPRRW